MLTLRKHFVAESGLPWALFFFSYAVLSPSTFSNCRKIKLQRSETPAALGGPLVVGQADRAGQRARRPPQTPQTPQTPAAALHCFQAGEPSQPLRKPLLTPGAESCSALNRGG